LSVLVRNEPSKGGGNGKNLAKTDDEPRGGLPPYQEKNLAATRVRGDKTSARGKRTEGKVTSFVKKKVGRGHLVAEGKGRGGGIRFQRGRTKSGSP